MFIKRLKSLYKKACLQLVNCLVILVLIINRRLKINKKINLYSISKSIQKLFRKDIYRTDFIVSYKNIFQLNRVDTLLSDALYTNWRVKPFFQTAFVN